MKGHPLGWPFFDYHQFGDLRAARLNPSRPRTLNFRPPGRLRPPRRTCASTQRGFPDHSHRNGSAVAGVTDQLFRHCDTNGEELRGPVGDAPQLHQHGGETTVLPCSGTQSVPVEATNHHGKIDAEGRPIPMVERTDRSPIKVSWSRSIAAGGCRANWRQNGDRRRGGCRRCQHISTPFVALHNVDYGHFGLRSQYPFGVMRRGGTTNTLMEERLGSRCGSDDLLAWPWSGRVKVLDIEMRSSGCRRAQN